MNMTLDPPKLRAKAELLKAMAHPIRLCILVGLLDQGECNVSRMQACLAMPQSTVSQSLGVLRRAGLITSRRQGTEVFYAISNPAVAHLLHALLQL